MILYHASPKKFRILKPAKPASYSKGKLVHDSVVWFSKRSDYTVFMVLFRCVEEEIPGKYRFFDWRKKALYQKAQELELERPCRVYVHEAVEFPSDLKKSKWGITIQENRFWLARYWKLRTG